MAAFSTDFQNILRQLQSNDSNLTFLDLSFKEIGNNETIAMANALKINYTLIKLDLLNNQIGKEGGSALAEAIKTNSTLTELDLGKNEIGKEGGIAMAEALKINSSLTYLDLYGNQIGNEGGIALAAAFKINATLTTLDVQHNEIGNEGGIALMEALTTNFTLTELGFWNNQIPQHVLDGMNVKLQPEAREIRKKSAPFFSVLTKFNLSANSLTQLFDYHGLDLETIKYLTIEELRQSVKDNKPHLPPLQIKLLLEELKEVALAPLPTTLPPPA